MAKSKWKNEIQVHNFIVFEWKIENNARDKTLYLVVTCVKYANKWTFRNQSISNSYDKKLKFWSPKRLALLPFTQKLSCCGLNIISAILFIKISLSGAFFQFHRFDGFTWE